jgi:urea transport system permease protein
MVIMARLLRLLALLSVTLFTAQAQAQDDFDALVRALAEGNFSAKADAVAALASTGDPRAVPVLHHMSDGDLQARKSDGAVFYVTGSGDALTLHDPATDAEVGTAAKDELKKITVNNSLRRTIRDAVAALTLQSPDPALRLAAADEAFRHPDPESVAAFDAAIAAEADAAVKARFEEARAAAILEGDAPEADKLAAVETVAGRGDRDALSLLNGLASGEGAVADAARGALTAIEQTQFAWSVAQNVYYGLSLGSVLLLAAIGLAITFGVMGVINMAHGEMVMLGAYTTFVVQSAIQAAAPGLLDYSLLIAVPLAFLVSGLVGIAIERGIIRFLYGRPLETLLATWGVSLILQQAVRSIFGPTNRQVSTPGWMSGASEVGWMTITYNRLVIIAFALVVFAVITIVLRRTRFGLQIRAVTQNRRMAGSVGIRTRRIDALTFGLGSGVAGMAGVALSQIDNVSPNLGQSYIIDSFMVVVFGGVGNLWGTLVGAATLGIANKFLEPFTGAVLGKILVLVLIILFIQKRPRGLFALKGRSVES